MRSRRGSPRRGEALAERAELETRNRELLERMLAAPAEHKWARRSHAPTSASRVAVTGTRDPVSARSGC